MFGLEVYGIYEDEIENAEKIANNLCYRFVNRCVDLDMQAEILEEIGNWDDITNSIIYSLFESALITCLPAENFDQNKIDIYVNGSDSHIIYDGEFM